MFQEQDSVKKWFYRHAINRKTCSINESTLIMAVIAGEKTDDCELPKNEFHPSGNLIQKSVDAGKRLHKCEVCDASFSERNGLK